MIDAVNSSVLEALTDVDRHWWFIYRVCWNGEQKIKMHDIFKEKES